MRERELVPKELLVEFIKKATCESKTKLKFINQCAPMIEGLKPSSFVLIPKCHKRIWEQLIKEYKLQSVVLYQDQMRVAILIYQENHIIDCVIALERKQYLASLGYEVNSLRQIIDQLAERLTNYYEIQSAFPHELGILLGYPLSDVIGYVNQEPVLYSGYWKVYSNVEEMKETFHKYDRSRLKLLVEYLRNVLSNN